MGKFLYRSETGELSVASKWRPLETFDPNHLPLALDDEPLVQEVFGPRETWPAQLTAEEYRVWRRWGDGCLIAANSRNSAAADRPRSHSCFIRVEAELAKETNDKIPFLPLRLPRDPRATFESRELTIQSLLGSGGMGKVYRAWSIARKQAVAVKFLRKSLLAYPAAIERFVDEAQTLAQLRHPGIVGVHGLGQSRHGNYFLVMDLIPNGDLARILQNGTVELQQVIEWGVEIANALEVVHAQGIIHCDLKPANLLLSDDRHIVVTDFGLAERTSTFRTQPGGGTAAYMAPEQFDPGMGEIGPATDIYGLGAVLFHLLIGRAPSAHIPCQQLLPIDQKQNHSPRFHELVRILECCLNPSPQHRLSSMAELRVALTELVTFSE